MKIFGKRFRQTVCQGLKEHRIIGIAFFFKLVLQRFGTYTGCHDKRSDIIRTAFRSRYDVVGKRFINTLFLFCLLTQHRDHKVSYPDIIPIAVSREKSVNGLTVFHFHIDQTIQQFNGILV